MRAGTWNVPAFNAVRRSGARRVKRPELPQDRAYRLLTYLRQLEASGGASIYGEMGDPDYEALDIQEVQDGNKLGLLMATVGGWELCAEVRLLPRGREMIRLNATCVGMQEVKFPLPIWRRIWNICL